jgi:hypothetical protein
MLVEHAWIWIGITAIAGLAVITVVANWLWLRR